MAWGCGEKELNLREAASAAKIRWQLEIDKLFKREEKRES